MGIKRRDFLKIAGQIGLGCTVTNIGFNKLFAEQKMFKHFEGKAKSVIFIFLPGGLSAQESFNPKPYASIEYRGPFNAINTSLDGVQFNQFFKETAKIANKLTIINSMTHGEAAHERGTHNMYTGYRPNPALLFPSMGSVVSHELGSRNNLPPYICIPNQPNRYAGTGYLSTAFSPFSLGGDPAQRNFQIKDLKPGKDIDEDRERMRREMLQTIEGAFPGYSEADVIKAMDKFYEKAYTLIDSPKAKEAFQLSAENGELRKEYGYNQAGQRFMMARRLVEYGARFVSVTYGGWDHHENIKDGISRTVPNLDKAFAALIKDLEGRGLLDSTLVVLTSEFGRTPKINNRAGRDHYPRVFSSVLCGAGIKRGFVYGKSDPTASEVEEDPVTVPDFAYTIYDQLGIVSEKELLAPGDRPIEIVKDGKVIKELLS